MDPNRTDAALPLNADPQLRTKPGLEDPQRASRPDGTSTSTFSAPPPNVLKTGQAGTQETNLEAALRKDAALGDNAETEAASAKAAAGLDPNGRITNRPDLIRAEQVAKEQAARPLNEGGIFTFVPPGGNGAGLTLAVRNGDLIVTMQPDKGLPVAVAIGGADLERLRASLR